MATMKTDTKSTVQSLDRGLAILVELLDGELSVTEVAARLDIDKSTAYRLLSTLESRGFVTQNDRNRKYLLGLTCIKLAGSVLQGLNVRDVARPYLELLTEETGETSFLGLLEDSAVVYVDRVRSSSPLAVTSDVGARAPLHSTATAKAVLAYLPVEAVRPMILRANRVAHTPRTMTNPELIVGHLEQVRQRGYAMDDEEFCIGLRCVASPIFDHSGHVVGSISVSGPAQRVTLERVDELGRRVRQVADELSRSLGYVRS